MGNLNSSISNVDDKLEFWGISGQPNNSTIKLIHGGYSNGMEFVSNSKTDMTNWIRFYDNYLQYQHRENGQWVEKWTIYPTDIVLVSGTTEAASLNAMNGAYLTLNLNIPNGYTNLGAIKCTPSDRAICVTQNVPKSYGFELGVRNVTTNYNATSYTIDMTAFCFKKVAV